MLKTDVLQERAAQDYRSTYNDIRDWFRREKEGKAPEESKIDWDDVKTVLKDGGVAIMSTGYGEGEGRVKQAIEDALNSPSSSSL